MDWGRPSLLRPGRQPDPGFIAGPLGGGRALLAGSGRRRQNRGTRRPADPAAAVATLRKTLAEVRPYAPALATGAVRTLARVIARSED